MLLHRLIKSRGFLNLTDTRGWISNVPSVRRQGLEEWRLRILPGPTRLGLRTSSRFMSCIVNKHNRTWRRCTLDTFVLLLILFLHLLEISILEIIQFLTLVFYLKQREINRSISYLPRKLQKHQITFSPHYKLITDEARSQNDDYQSRKSSPMPIHILTSCRGWPYAYNGRPTHWDWQRLCRFQEIWFFRPTVNRPEIVGPSKKKITQNNVNISNVTQNM